MSVQELSTFEFGDMAVTYLEDEGQVGFSIVPADGPTPAQRRDTLKGVPEVDLLPPQMSYPRAWHLDPLVHISLLDGRGPGGFSRGKTMRGSPAQKELTLVGQTVEETDAAISVLTELADRSGLKVSHNLIWERGRPYVRVQQWLTNGSSAPITVDMVSSFTLSHLSPFAPEDAPGRLWIHRFRSDWSAEARHLRQSAEELGLEPSWLGHGVRNERFGQVGTMPVRNWAPAVFVEDSAVGVFWGASLSWAGSWQFELYRKDDCLNVSGGLADREFGHWFHTLAAGEVLDPPPAVITVCAGDLDRAADRLTRSQLPACLTHPTLERELPVVFNEWCTSWGNPTEESLTQIADLLQGEDIRYLVIDAGWYKPPNASWSDAQGDWRVSPRAFPNGLAAASEAIRRRGLVPGLWFEFECIGESSEAWARDETYQLKLDGVPIDSGGRRFWDMRSEQTREILEERVIDLLDAHQIGYLKIDYNETAGFGADGEESPGEGIRRHVEGIYRFLERIRERLPQLVIENCSSGGHRLEPSLVGRTAMSSFSDAHECSEIPIIAANAQRLLLPRQSQIWAVLHRLDPPKRLIYSLAAGFLGRLCLSGEITDLAGPQWGLLRGALKLYREAAPTIALGHSHRFGPNIKSYRHPTGWQVVVRYRDDGREALVVAHRFEDEASPITVPLSGRSWTLCGTLCESTASVSVGGGAILIEGLTRFSAAVALLRSD